MEHECAEILEVGEGPSICVSEMESVPSGRHAAVLEDIAYGMKMRVDGEYNDILELTKRALAKEGFHLMTEIDLQKSFKSKLGIDYPRYTILGGCDPVVARRALEMDMDIGLLLPCNVVVYEHGGACMVAAIDPIAQLSIADGSELRETALLVKRRLQAVINHVASGTV